MVRKRMVLDTDTKIALLADWSLSRTSMDLRLDEEGEMLEGFQVYHCSSIYK